MSALDERIDKLIGPKQTTSASGALDDRIDAVLATPPEAQTAQPGVLSRIGATITGKPGAYVRPEAFLAPRGWGRPEETPAPGLTYGKRIMDYAQAWGVTPAEAARRLAEMETTQPLTGAARVGQAIEPVLHGAGVQAQRDIRGAISRAMEGPRAAAGILGLNKAEREYERLRQAYPEMGIMQGGRSLGALAGYPEAFVPQNEPLPYGRFRQGIGSLGMTLAELAALRGAAGKKLAASKLFPPAVMAGREYLTGGTPAETAMAGVMGTAFMGMGEIPSRLIRALGIPAAFGVMAKAQGADDNAVTQSIVQGLALELLMGGGKRKGVRIEELPKGQRVPESARGAPRLSPEMQARVDAMRAESLQGVKPPTQAQLDAAKAKFAGLIKQGMTPEQILQLPPAEMQQQGEMIEGMGIFAPREPAIAPPPARAPFPSRRPKPQKVVKFPAEKPIGQELRQERKLAQKGVLRRDIRKVSGPQVPGQWQTGKEPALLDWLQTAGIPAKVVAAMPPESRIALNQNPKLLEQFLVRQPKTAPVQMPPEAPTRPQAAIQAPEGARVPPPAPKAAVEAPGPAVPVKPKAARAKEPWKMTRAEWIEDTRAKLEPSNAEFLKLGFSGKTEPNVQAHHNQVMHALEQGKPVPPEVLADYPDLAEKYTPKPAPGKPVQRTMFQERAGERGQATLPTAKEMARLAREADLARKRLREITGGMALPQVRKDERGMVISPDELNRVVSQRLTEPIGAKIMEKMPSGLRDPFTQTKGIQKAFQKMRANVPTYDMAAEKLIGTMESGLGKLSKADRDALFLVMAGEKPLASLPEHMRPTSAWASKWLRDITQSMGKERDQFGKAVREKWLKGDQGWLARYFAKHAQKVAGERWYNFGRKLSSLTRAERGHEMAQESSLYVIKNPKGKTVTGGAFESQSEARAFLANLQKRQPGIKFHIRPPVSWEELVKGGKLVPLEETIRRSLGEGGRALEKTRFMTGLAKDAAANGLVSSEQIQGYVPFRSTRVELGKIDAAKNPSLAMLKDSYIHPSLAGDLKTYVGADNAFVRMIRAMGEPEMRFLQTAGSVYRWVRSYPENVQTIALGDAPVLADPRFWARVKRYHGKLSGPYADAIKARGILEETFAASFGKGEAGRLGKVGKGMDAVRRTYGKIDFSFKAALYDYYQSMRGLNEQDAYTAMEDVTFNFRDMPRWVTAAGKIAPFRPGVTYNFARVIGTQMRKKPVTFGVKVALAVFGGYQARAHQVEKLNLSVEEKKRLPLVAIPLYRDKNQRLVTMDLAWLVPFGDVSYFPTSVEDVPQFLYSFSPMILRPLVAGALGLRTSWGYPIDLKAKSKADEVKTVVKEVLAGYRVGMADMPFRAIKEAKKPEGQRRGPLETLVVTPTTGIRTQPSAETLSAWKEAELNRRIEEIMRVGRAAKYRAPSDYEKTQKQLERALEEIQKE